MSCCINRKTPRANTPLFKTADIETEIKTGYLKNQKIRRLLKKTSANPKKPLVYDSTTDIWTSCNKVVNLNKKSCCPIGFEKLNHKCRLRFSKKYAEKFNTKISKIDAAFKLSQTQKPKPPTPTPSISLSSTSSEKKPVDPIKQEPATTPPKNKSIIKEPLSKPQEKTKKPKPELQANPPKNEPPANEIQELQAQKKTELSEEEPKPLALKNPSAQLPHTESAPTSEESPSSSLKESSSHESSSSSQADEDESQEAQSSSSKSSSEKSDSTSSASQSTRSAQKSVLAKPVKQVKVIPFSPLDGFCTNLVQKPEDIEVFVQAQNLQANPLINFKACMEDILKEGPYFKNCILPGLKALSLIAAADDITANQYAVTWQTRLKSLAKTWGNSDSRNQPNDEFLGKSPLQCFTMFQFLSNLFAIMPCMQITATDAVKEIKTLKIPHKLELNLESSDIATLLESFLQDKKTKLSSLFKTSEVKNWGSIYQFLCAFSAHNLYKDMEKAASSKEFRKGLLDGIATIKKIEMPGILITAVRSVNWLLGESALIWSLKQAIPALSTFKLHAEPAALDLFAAENKLSENQKQTFESCKTFSKDPKREDFYTEYNGFISGLRTDILTLFVSRAEIGEFKISELLSLGIGLYEDAMGFFDKVIEYLNILDQHPENTQLHEQKQKAVEDAQKASLLKHLKFVQILANSLFNGHNFKALISLTDTQILPSLKENPPPNLFDADHPFGDWLIDHVVAPLKKL